MGFSWHSHQPLSPAPPNELEAIDVQLLEMLLAAAAELHWTIVEHLIYSIVRIFPYHISLNLNPFLHGSAYGVCIQGTKIANKF